MPTALTSDPIHPNLMLEGINVTVMNPAERPEPKKRFSKNEMANFINQALPDFAVRPFAAIGMPLNVI